MIIIHSLHWETQNHKALPVLQDPDELIKSALLGDRGIKEVDPSARSIFVVHWGKLQTSEDQMTIPEEPIRQADEVPVDTTAVWHLSAGRDAALRKCLCVCVWKQVCREMGWKSC